MKLTKEILKEMITVEMADLQKENEPPEGEEASTQTKISYTGMKKFAEFLLAGQAIPAGIVEKARQEMQADPSANVMAEFVAALCRSFGIDESELTRILSGVRKGL